MRWLERAIENLFPVLLIGGTPWQVMWEERERDIFLAIAKVFCTIVAVAYLAHFFFFDLRMGLEPIESWFAFRFSMATGAIVCLVFYFSPMSRLRMYKIPIAVLCWIMAFTQARVTVNYPDAPWLYCFVFVTVFSIILRTSAVNSALYASVLVASQWSSLVEAGVPELTIVSATVVMIAAIAFLRTSYASDIRNFLLVQENLAAQKRIIELNIEFADRIRAFIPRIIASRLERYVKDRQMSVIEASVEVLRPRVADIACIFSDIRGFTQASKDLERFVANSVMPEVKVTSDAVEEYGGIPRKVGDLVFAYFDDDQIRRNLLNAVAGGFAIARSNQVMNATAIDLEIRRYILISCGKAIVGNLGGLDSSIEITALGSPVNFLSRVDELTKSPNLRDMLEPSHLVICERSESILREMGIELDMQQVDLRKLDLSIRDFPEANYLYTIRPNDENYERVMAAYTSAGVDFESVLGDESVRAAG